MTDLDRAFVINGDDLSDVLAGPGVLPAGASSAAVATHILGRAAKPLDGTLVTESQLAGALEGFYLEVSHGGSVINGDVHDADEFARVLYATLGRMAALREPGPCPFHSGNGELGECNCELEGQDEPVSDEPDSTPTGYEDVDAIRTILQALDGLSGESGAGWGYAVNVLRFVAGRYGLLLTEDEDA